MDEETTEEKDVADRDDLTENEAHRVGEFDDIRDMLVRALDKLDAMNDRIDGIYDNFADSRGADGRKRRDSQGNRR